MPPREDLILFLDLETTGSADNEEIIEVGLVLLAAPDWREIDTFTHVVYPSGDAFTRMLNNYVVFDMHTKSGLINEYGLVQSAGHRVETVEQKILDWLDQHTGKNNTHIPYGGSGVGHFDRKFIDKYMPRFAKRITYWPYDVGVVRRIYTLAGGREWPSQDDKTHRALDDARVHAKEFRFALNLIEDGLKYEDLRNS